MKVWAVYLKVTNTCSYDGTEEVLHGLYINEELANKAKLAVDREYTPTVECMYIEEE